LYSLLKYSIKSTEIAIPCRSKVSSFKISTETEAMFYVPRVR